MIATDAERTQSACDPYAFDRLWPLVDKVADKDYLGGFEAALKLELRVRGLEDVFELISTAVHVTDEQDRPGRVTVILRGKGVEGTRRDEKMINTPRCEQDALVGSSSCVHVWA